MEPSPQYVGVRHQAAHSRIRAAGCCVNDSSGRYLMTHWGSIDFEPGKVRSTTLLRASAKTGYQHWPHIHA